jgi:hypothetical protein
MSLVDDPVVEREPVPRRGRGLVTKIVLGVVIALIAAMWIYAFLFASKKGAYRIDDDAWRERAEQVCEKWEDERLKLVDMDEGYIEEPTQEQMLQRADLVEKATDIIQAEIDEVTAVQPDNERDRGLVAKYRGFVETLIQDRRDYIAQLRRFELAPYRESTETPDGGGPVSNVIIDFTTVNEIRSCAPPGELGGDT